MVDIVVKKLTLGPIRTNCYIAFNGSTREAFIIDPADNGDLIIESMIELKVIPKTILLTHGHFDHIGAVSELKEEYHIPVCLYQAEKDVIESEDSNASRIFGKPFTCTADRWLEDGEILSLLDTTIQVIHTPGHTKGSCCYYMEKCGVLFSGDTLFYSTYGRTDLPTGNENHIFNSIREKLLVLKGNTIVYPGHDRETTIDNEKKWYL